MRLEIRLCESSNPIMLDYMLFYYLSQGNLLIFYTSFSARRWPGLYYCLDMYCVLYIIHVSDISAIIVHIHFQRICITDIIMPVLGYISQLISANEAKLNQKKSIYVFKTKNNNKIIVVFIVKKMI